MKEKIGILGSGPVGQILGSGFIKHGCQVMVGSRDTAKLAEWKKQAGAKAKTGSVSEAAAFGDILVLAVKGSAAREALQAAGAKHLAGKRSSMRPIRLQMRPP